MHTRVANLTAAACAGSLLVLAPVGPIADIAAAHAESRAEPTEEFYEAQPVADAARGNPTHSPIAGPGMPPLAMVLVALGFIALGRRRWRSIPPLRGA